MKYLLDQAKVLSAITGTAGAAGTTDVSGTIIDSAGFTNVLALVNVGPITSTGTCVLLLKGSTSSTFADGGTTVAQVTADAVGDKSCALEYCNDAGTYRYFRLIADRGTANSVVAANYLLYGASAVPVTQSVTVAVAKSSTAPDKETIPST